MAAGIVIFLAVSPPTNGVSAPRIGTWIPVFLAMGILVALAAVAALRVRGKARVIWLAAAAGALYLGRRADQEHGGPILQRRLGHPRAVGAVRAGRHRRGGRAVRPERVRGGALSLSLPVIDTLEPVCAVVIGATVFGERLASSPVQLGFQLAGGAAAVAGIWMLSRSKIGGGRDP